MGSKKQNHLLDDDRIEMSSVVANRCMNRERVLRGPNGYAREIGFDALDFLIEKLDRTEHVRWLDLCCGTGKALIEAATILVDRKIANKASIHGVDLVDFFAPGPYPDCLVLEEASLHCYSLDDHADLITCVHGLHYVGDKLDVIARACSWLSENGVFVATLDVGTIALSDGRSSKRQIPRILRSQGFEVDMRRHRIQCRGPRTIDIPWTYLGADVRGGVSFTGEKAVISHYD